MMITQERDLTDIREIESIPIHELKACKISKLYETLERIKDLYESAKRKKSWIEGVIALKFEEAAGAERERTGKTTGTVHLEIEGFKITSDVPKKVEWDQTKLKEIVDKIIKSGGDVKNYVETIYHISESNYNSFSSAIKSLLEPARTLKLGKSACKIKPIETSLLCEGWL